MWAVKVFSVDNYCDRFESDPWKSTCHHHTFHLRQFLVYKQIANTHWATDILAFLAVIFCQSMFKHSCLIKIGSCRFTLFSFFACEWSMIRRIQKQPQIAHFSRSITWRWNEQVKIEIRWIWTTSTWTEKDIEIEIITGRTNFVINIVFLIIYSAQMG